MKNNIKFPYYIVRFKPDAEQEKKAKKIEFPYYIVRFKRKEINNNTRKNTCKLL